MASFLLPPAVSLLVLAFFGFWLFWVNSEEVTTLTSCFFVSFFRLKCISGVSVLAMFTGSGRVRRYGEMRKNNFRCYGTLLVKKILISRSRKPRKLKNWWRLRSTTYQIRIALLNYSCCVDSYRRQIQIPRALERLEQWQGFTFDVRLACLFPSLLTTGIFVSRHASLSRQIFLDSEKEYFIGGGGQTIKKS
jgi:hypothetical protein